MAQQVAEVLMLFAILCEFGVHGLASYPKRTTRTNSCSQILQTLPDQLAEANRGATICSLMQRKQRLGDRHFDCRKLMHTLASPSIHLGENSIPVGGS